MGLHPGDFVVDEVEHLSHPSPKYKPGRSEDGCLEASIMSNDALEGTTTITQRLAYFSFLRRRQLAAGEGVALAGYDASSARSAFASIKSSVPEPSVNQP